MIVRVIFTAALSLLLHLVLGWAWTLGAGILGGVLAERHGWMVGAAGVGVGWMALVGYSSAVAPGATGALLDILSGLFGNIPAILVVVCTVFIGVLLGALGGVLGTTGRALLSR